MKQLALVAAMLFMVQAAVASESYILKIKPGTNLALFEAQNHLALKAVAADAGLYMATPVASKFVATALSNLNANNAVAFAQPNHKITYRASLTPNDKKFGEQWGYQLNGSSFGINAVEAWSVHGTGGMDVTGNEIVIAVVDGGFDVNHPDLINNLWINKGEIASNGIDDDGNGYVDDVQGWDVESESGTLTVEEHGTHVAGTMGAQGNNGLAGVGVNWNIKIMYVSMGYSLADTASTMAAYGYILKQKKIWIQSGGKQGANVVSVNSSFGIDEADCNSSEYSAWNDMYNQMGEVGILNVAATANADSNIDKVGDVPTACSSDFLVSVTNSERNGNKSVDAGYGKKTIDLAAPGTDIMSTLPDKGFGENTGTSMATPHVTGAIGYLYSAASEAFINSYTADPKAGALAMKATLLKTVTARPNMATNTVSGGILNLFSASQDVANYVQITPYIVGKFQQ